MPKNRHFLACSKIPRCFYVHPNEKMFTFSCQTFHGLSYDLLTLSRSLAPIESKKIEISYTRHARPFSNYNNFFETLALKQFTNKTAIFHEKQGKIKFKKWVEEIIN